MLARTPRLALGQFEDFVDFFGYAPDAFAVDALDLSQFTLDSFDFLPEDFAMTDFYETGLPIPDAMANAYPLIEASPLPEPEVIAPPTPEGVNEFDSVYTVTPPEMVPTPDPEAMPWGTDETVDGGFNLPGAGTVLDAAARIVAVGASIFASKTQADIAAMRANAGAAGGVQRYQTRVDPLTGKVVVIDTFTGQPVKLDPVTGLPVTTGFPSFDAVVSFVKANAFPLAAAGAILAVMLMRVPPERRQHVRRAQRDIHKRG